VTDACAANTDDRHVRALERIAPFGPHWETARVLGLLSTP
jgi:hypothetical protein